MQKSWVKLRSGNDTNETKGVSQVDVKTNTVTQVAVKSNETSQAVATKTNTAPSTAAKLNAVPQATAEPVEEVKPKTAAELKKDEGNKLLALGQQLKAIELFTEAVQIDPMYHIAYHNRGVVYKDLKRYKEALADFSRCIQLKPNYAKSFFNRGIVFMAIEEFQNAIIDLEEAKRLQPSAESSKKLEECLNAHAKFLEQKDLEKSNATNPKNENQKKEQLRALKAENRKKKEEAELKNAVSTNASLAAEKEQLQKIVNDLVASVANQSEVPLPPVDGGITAVDAKPVPVIESVPTFTTDPAFALLPIAEKSVEGAETTNEQAVLNLDDSGTLAIEKTAASIVAPIAEVNAKSANQNLDAEQVLVVNDEEGK